MSEQMISTLIAVFLADAVIAYAAFTLIFDRNFKKQRAFLKHIDRRTPRHHVVWRLMAETTTPLGRILMNRRKLMNEVANLVVENSYPAEIDHSSNINDVKDYLRKLSTTSIFFAKQSLLVAKHRDYCHATSFLPIIAGLIRRRDFDDAALIGMNIDRFPRTSTTIAAFRGIARSLGIREGIVPRVDVQLKAAYYSREIGYEGGYDGELVHIIKDHVDDYTGIVEYCAERGVRNFSEDEYRKYTESGVLRVGVL